MNRHVLSVAVGWVLAAALGAQVADANPVFMLEDHGDTTYDPNTGLEWLDLGLTAGQSYSSVLGGWNGYTTAQGYRFATRNEVIQLFMDAGAATIGFQSGAPNGADLQAAGLALSLLGTTLAQADLSRSWMYYDPATEPTLPGSLWVPCAVFGVGVIRAGYPQEGFFDVPGIFPTQDYSNPVMASALVRAVPEPSATALMGSGIGLGVIALWCNRRPRGMRTLR